IRAVLPGDRTGKHDERECDRDRGRATEHGAEPHAAARISVLLTPRVLSDDHRYTALEAAVQHVHDDKQAHRDLIARECGLAEPRDDRGEDRVEQLART